MRTDTIKVALFNNLAINSELILRQPNYNEDLSSILTAETYNFQTITPPSSSQFYYDATNLRNQNTRLTYVVEWQGNPIGWFYFDMRANTNNIQYNWGLLTDARNAGWMNETLTYLKQQLLNLGAKYFIKYNLLTDTVAIQVMNSQGMNITLGIQNTAFYPQIGNNETNFLYNISFDNSSKKGCGCAK